MKMQLPQLFRFCHFNCLITMLLALYILFFITLIQISFWGEVAAGNHGIEVRFHTFSLSFLPLEGRELLEVHKQMFGLFLPFPQHLHHPAKIRLLFFLPKLSNKYNSPFWMSAERILLVGLHSFILHNTMCPAHFLRICLCLTMVMKQLYKERLMGIRQYWSLCPL